MFANPEVTDFIDRLIGGQTPRGGTPPQSQGYRDTLARSLLGDITKPSIRAPLPATAIEAYRRPIATPAQSVGVNRGVGSQEQQEVGGHAPSIGTNAGALSAGIENLGRGIEGGIEGIAANRQNAAEIAALGQGGAFPKFGGGVSNSTGPAAASNGSTLPSFARQPGVNAGTPTTAEQFLNGIKAAEGVPYSGQSSTGAIGAYGLTGGFIKQWAPGAGLPTDRASYMNNPALQDQLATYAATQMHNQFGSWAPVANAWLTGSPTATTSAPGNMSPAAYVAKVMSNAGMTQPSTGMAAADKAQDQQQDAADTARQAPPAQSVTPGQQNPHLPGFDPSSVSFTNTPIGQQGMLLPPQAGPSNAMNPLALALASGQMPPVDPNFGGSPSGLFG